MSYIVTQESFDSLASCWSDPSQHLRWNSIFVLPAWLQVWWQELGSEAELYLAAIRQGEKIIGIAPLQIREGDTGYFYETAPKTAQRVINLLKNRKAAEALGQRGREYVGEHFLLPDRIADYLMAMDMTMNKKGNGHRQMPHDSIISFHPWFKMSKRRS